MNGEMILLLDPGARAGRTGYRLKVRDAQRARAEVRNALGTTRENTPSTVQLLRAAKAISALLFDATEGDARLVVQLGKGDDVEMHSPATVLGTLS